MSWWRSICASLFLLHSTEEIPQKDVLSACHLCCYSCSDCHHRCCLSQKLRSERLSKLYHDIVWMKQFRDKCDYRRALAYPKSEIYIYFCNRVQWSRLKRLWEWTIQQRKEYEPFVSNVYFVLFLAIISFLIIMHLALEKSSESGDFKDWLGLCALYLFFHVSIILQFVCVLEKDNSSFDGH